MSETTQTKAANQRQRRKPARFVKRARQRETGVLTLRQVRPRAGDPIHPYRLEPIASDIGRGLLLHKADGTSYAVCLSGPDSTCDCKGHVSHGHCKHVESLLALQQRGKL